MNDSKIHARAASLLAALAISTSAVQAQSFDFTLGQTASTVDMLGTYGVTMDAVFRGNYDATTNPGGTRTVPGLWGGSGNNDIDVDIDLNGDLDHMGTPTGVITMNVDELALTFDVTQIDVDLLGGASTVSDQTLDLLFATFRTFAPNSTFPGGSSTQLDNPGQLVSDLIIALTGPPVSGSLTTGAVSGIYGVAALVPVSYSMVLDFQGTPTFVGPIDSVLILDGTLNMNGPQPVLSVVFNQTIQETIVNPSPPIVLTDVPFDVDTVLPSGSTAHLLITGLVEQLDLVVDVDAMLVGDGTPACGFTSYCPATPNSTGMAGQLDVVGSTDVVMQDLTFNSTDLPLNVFGYYLMSPAQGAISLPAPSQGILCVGSPLYRLNSYILHSGMTGQMTLALDFNNLPMGQVFQAGSTWNFQLWHRDMNPTTTSNTTNAVEVRFCQ